MDELFPEAPLLELLCTTTRIFADIARHVLMKPILRGSDTSAAPRRPNVFFARIWVSLDDLHTQLGSMKSENTGELYKKLGCALDTYEDCVSSHYATGGALTVQYGSLRWFEAQFGGLEEPGSSEPCQDLFLRMPEEYQSKLEVTVDKCKNILFQITTSRLHKEKVPTRVPLEELCGLREWRLPAVMGQFACELRSSFKQKLLQCRCAPDGKEGLNAETKIAFIVYAADSAASQLCSRHTLTENFWRSAILKLFNGGPPGSADSVPARKLWLPCATLCKALNHEVARPKEPDRPVTSLMPSADNFAQHKVLRISATKLEVLREDTVTDKARVDLSTPLIQNCQVDTLSSLHESFPWSQADISLKQRLIVAINLAYTYLHLLGTEWWPLTMVGPNVWFAKQGKVLDTRRIFLDIQAGSFDDIPHSLRRSGHKESSVEMLINKACPSLPAFGKLLLEVHRGSSFEWGNFYLVLEECRNDENDVYGNVWAEMADACIDRGGFQDIGELKSMFRSSVLAKLHWIARKWNLDENSIFDLTVSSSRHQHNLSSVSVTPELVPRSPPLPQTGHIVVDAASGDATVVRTEDTESAESWLRNMDEFRINLNNSLSQISSSLKSREGPVKVAIIDTGVQFDKRTETKLFGGRIKGRWPSNLDGLPHGQSNTGYDIDGHGTNITSLLLNVDQVCHVHIYRAFHCRSELQDAEHANVAQRKVVQAINHAIYEWKTDIISLSCGFENPTGELEQVVRNAESRHVLIFAASGNFGANEKTSWPARQRSVIPIYASDGDGNPYRKNPKPQPDRSRFSTLGVAVKVMSHLNSSRKELRSGTSIATVVAAGLASSMLHFMRMQKWNYLDMPPSIDDVVPQHHGESREQGYDRLMKTMLTPTGMEAVFRLMAEERNGYNYIAPWKLSSKYGYGPHLVTTILRALKEA